MVKSGTATGHLEAARTSSHVVLARADREYLAAFFGSHGHSEIPTASNFSITILIRIGSLSSGLEANARESPHRSPTAGAAGQSRAGPPG